MNAIAQSPRASTATGTLSLETLRQFIEDEAGLLDEGRFQEWYELFTEDASYWAPGRHGQDSPFSHISLFYDDKHTLKTRVTRLAHPQLHCQEPASHCVRVVSSVRLQEVQGTQYSLSSRFLMVEDRIGAPQRLFGGRLLHRLRDEGGGQLRIVQKRVELTNCEQSFAMLTQPF